MGFLCDVYDISLGFLGAFYSVSMGFIWGILLKFLTVFYDISKWVPSTMAFQWDFYGPSMGCYYESLSYF